MSTGDPLIDVLWVGSCWSVRRFPAAGEEQTLEIRFFLFELPLAELRDSMIGFNGAIGNRVSKTCVCGVNDQDFRGAIGFHAVRWMTVRDKVVYSGIFGDIFKVFDAESKSCFTFLLGFVATVPILVVT